MLKNKTLKILVIVLFTFIIITSVINYVENNREQYVTDFVDTFLENQEKLFVNLLRTRDLTLVEYTLVQVKFNLLANTYDIRRINECEFLTRQDEDNEYFLSLITPDMSFEERKEKFGFMLTEKQALAIYLPLKTRERDIAIEVYMKSPIPTHYFIFGKSFINKAFEKIETEGISQNGGGMITKWCE